jgi:hypothetical protein
VIILFGKPATETEHAAQGQQDHEEQDAYQHRIQRPVDELIVREK